MAEAKKITQYLKHLYFWFFEVKEAVKVIGTVEASERVTADDVTVRPWPGGKYDLIQLHRQIRHQNARNLFFTTKLSLPPAIKIKILRKQ